MAIFPTNSFSKDEITIHWGQKYVSDALNKKSLGFPKGVYTGFTPSVDGGDPANLINLSIDPTEGYSLLRVKSNSSIHLIDIITELDVQLNFTGHVQFPSYVIARASYNLFQTTTAEFFTRTTPGDGIEEITVCRVEKNGGFLEVYFTDVPADRHEPTAYTGQAAGFMPGGSVENLEAAVNTTAEVNTARVDIDTGATQASLSDRLIQDFNTVADRLSRSIENVKGNSITLTTGIMLPTSTINISSSFGNLTRDFEPKINITDGGQEGIGSAGIDGAFSTSPHNYAILTNANTGEQIVEGGTGRTIYGRLQPVTTINTADSSEFVIASNVVTRVGATNDYITEGVQVGDLITGPDGSRYEITIVNAITLTISPAYQSPSQVQSAAVVERYTIDTFTLVNGVETSTAISDNGANISVLPYIRVASSWDVLNNDASVDLLALYKPPVAVNGGTDPGYLVIADDDRLVNVCKTDGTTPFTAAQSGINGSDPNHLITKNQLDAVTHTLNYWHGYATGRVLIDSRERTIFTQILSTGHVTHNNGDGSFTIAETGVYKITANPVMATPGGGAATLAWRMFKPAGENSALIPNPGAGFPGASASEVSRVEVDLSAGSLSVQPYFEAIVSLTNADTFDFIEFASGPEDTEFYYTNEKFRLSIVRIA